MDLTDLRKELATISEIIYFDKEQYLREKTSDPDRLKQVITKGETLLQEAEEQVENDEEKYFLYGTLGNLYRISGEPERAISYLTKSLDYAVKEGDRAKEIVALIRLGEAMKYNQQHQEALELFEQAFEKCKKYRVDSYLDFVLQHRGKCFLELSRVDEAKSCFLEALELRMAKGDPSLIDSTKQALEFIDNLS